MPDAIYKMAKFATEDPKSFLKNQMTKRVAKKFIDYATYFIENGNYSEDDKNMFRDAIDLHKEYIALHYKRP